ncbi:hypothetical protein ACF3MZ_23960 [Paenibacillaceae bacterium WGS1546]|uniref:hypothetical protein n=1 Tax=Cohnella sp. WGS1546 TaxID=3366810 RepID=UPI00372D0C65
MVETLAETAAWFREQYPLTPASAICALEDWKGEGRQSVWYYSRHYRINFYCKDGHLRIRDMHLYDETYAERYLRDICATKECCYDTLPVVDGARWNDDRTEAGIVPFFFAADGSIIPVVVETLRVDESVPGELTVVLAWQGGGSLTFHCVEDRIAVHSDRPDWGLRMIWGETSGQPLMQIDGNRVRFVFNGHPYSIGFESISELSRELTVQRDRGGRIDDIEHGPSKAIMFRPLDRELRILLQQEGIAIKGEG